LILYSKVEALGEIEVATKLLKDDAEMQVSVFNFLLVVVHIWNFLESFQCFSWDASVSYDIHVFSSYKDKLNI